MSRKKKHHSKAAESAMRAAPQGSFYDVQKLASASELTGLIPAAVSDAAEAEAYEALWPLPAQRPVNGEEER